MKQKNSLQNSIIVLWIGLKLTNHMGWLLWLTEVLFKPVFLLLHSIEMLQKNCHLERTCVYIYNISYEIFFRIKSNIERFWWTNWKNEIYKTCQKNRSTLNRIRDEKRLQETNLKALCHQVVSSLSTSAIEWILSFLGVFFRHGVFFKE